MRGEFNAQLEKLGGLTGEVEPADALTKLRGALSHVQPIFPDEPVFEGVRTAFFRMIAGLSTALALVDCHECLVERAPLRNRRPREFWVLCGQVALGLLAIFLTAATGQGMFSLAMLTVFLGVAVAGAIWGNAGSDRTSQAAPQGVVRAKGSALAGLVAESLSSLDDAQKVLAYRLRQRVVEEDDDLPGDVIDLVHRLLGDAATGRTSNRRSDVEELLAVRRIAVVDVPSPGDDYRFVSRFAPGRADSTVARPALVRNANGTVVRPGVVLVGDEHSRADG